jgi:hypothetical protein
MQKSRQQLLLYMIVRWTLESKDYHVTQIRDIVVPRLRDTMPQWKKAARGHKLGIKDKMTYTV